MSNMLKPFVTASRIPIELCNGLSKPGSGFRLDSKTHFCQYGLIFELIEMSDYFTSLKRLQKLCLKKQSYAIWRIFCSVVESYFFVFEPVK